MVIPSSLRRLSLKAQLVLYLMVGLVLLLVVFTSAINYLTVQRSEELTLSNAQQLSKSLSEGAVFGLLTDSAENTEDTLEQVLRFPDVAGAGVVDEQGNFLIWRGDLLGQSYFQSIQWTSPNSIPNLTETQRYWHLLSPVTISTAEQADEFDLLESGGQSTLGYALVTYNKANMLDFNSRVLLTIVVTGIAFAIGVLLAIVTITRQLLRPMERLSEAMLHINDAGSPRKTVEEGSLEVRLMAKAYNLMISTLANRDEQLRNYSDKLEAEVNIRTRELQEARDAALSANQHKSQFLANISHELRSPLNSIIGYISVISHQLADVKMTQVNDDLSRAKRSAERLLAMINQLLDLSSIEAGRMQLKPKSVELNKILEATKDAVLPLVPVNHNRFEVIGLPGLNPTINVDEEKLTQVLINLVSNACKFTQNGEVTLRVSLVDYRLQFIVRDTGRGIAQQDMESIFHPFTQVDMSRSREYQGTGLGLAISQQFCELMGGKILVKSKVGEGSEFIVTLPLN